jgi:hypothetical protein
MDDEEMGKQLKKNFESYASKMSFDAEEPEEEAEDTKTEVKEDKKFDLALYDKLKSENGKS